MAVLGFLEWCRQLRALRFAAAGDPPQTPPEPAPAEDADTPTAAAGSHDRDQGAGPATRLLLGTACGSVLLFAVALSARVAAGLGLGVPSPLTVSVLGVLGAAVVTALAAGVGRALRRRSAAGRLPGISGIPNPVDEPSPRPGREHGDAPGPG
ncbi:hypothetical protein ACWDWS_14635 [Streptomyces sp. NPDC003328]|uniref:hypothetical protein n=1 Tax=Streptomyces sp. NPDC091299 TaxID=3155302 RepID=UPI00341B0396